jgi:hypothetical protein
MNWISQQFMLKNTLIPCDPKNPRNSSKPKHHQFVWFCPSTREEDIKKLLTRSGDIRFLKNIPNNAQDASGH